MRFAVMAGLIAFASVSALAQNLERQAASGPERTFTSPDGVFQFRYPSQFSLCTEGHIEQCQRSYVPGCEPDALVCVAYEGAGAKYTAGGFQVKVIFREDVTGKWEQKYRRRLMQADADRCVTPGPNKGDPTATVYSISSEHPVEQIGGIRFVHGVFGGAAAGHTAWEDIYRAFHDGKCYELRVITTQADVPPMAAPDKKMVTQALMRVLHSFRFLGP